MFLLPVRGLPPSGWWGRRRESRERDSKRERQMLTGSMLLCLTDWQTDDATLKLIELTLEDPQTGTGSGTAKCSREASAVHLFPHFSFVSSVCLSLSFSHLSPSPPPSFTLCLPAISFACCICLCLKSTLKFINDNGQARPRRGQWREGRGRQKTQDNGRASDNPVLVAVGGHTNKSLSQYPFVLPFFETRRVESSWVEPSGEFSVAAAAVADASSFLNLQRNNSKYIRWLTHGQTDTRTAERANERAGDLTTTDASRHPAWARLAGSALDWLLLCLHPPPAPWAMIKVLSARRAAYAAFPAASLPASSQAARLIRPLSANSAFLLIATLHSRLPR